MRALAKVSAFDPAAVDRLIAGRDPGVVRGLAKDWPIVQAALEEGSGWLRLLRANAADTPVDVVVASPEADGRFHYAGDDWSMNFDRKRIPLAVFLDALEQELQQPVVRSIAAQGLPANRLIPAFSAVHPLPVVPDGAEPRLWIGTKGKVATHNDPTDNVAVVAAGRRRFTLFPPEAEDDLYMGPADPTPAGTPISMVHVTAPDFDRFPRFADALEAGFEAELDPGDAIYIPADWFHHVESLEPVNLLVNYWWPSTN